MRLGKMYDLGLMCSNCCISVFETILLKAISLYDIRKSWDNLDISNGPVSYTQTPKYML